MNRPIHKKPAWTKPLEKPGLATYTPELIAGSHRIGIRPPGRLCERLEKVSEQGSRLATLVVPRSVDLVEIETSC